MPRIAGEAIRPGGPNPQNEEFSQNDRAASRETIVVPQRLQSRKLINLFFIILNELRGGLRACWLHLELLWTLARPRDGGEDLPKDGQRHVPSELRQVPHSKTEGFT